MEDFWESRQDCWNIYTPHCRRVPPPPFFFFLFSNFTLYSKSNMGCKLKQKKLCVFYTYLVESSTFCTLTILLVATCYVPGFKVKFVPLFSCQYFCSVPEDYCILLCHCRPPACFVNLSLAKIYFNMNTAKERDFKENRSRLTVLRRQKKKYRSSCTVYSKDSLKYSPPDQLSASRICWKLLKTAFPFPLHFSPSFSPAPLCH